MRIVRLHFVALFPNLVMPLCAMPPAWHRFRRESKTLFIVANSNQKLEPRVSSTLVDQAPTASLTCLSRSRAA